jgi:hypothetical protein
MRLLVMYGEILLGQNHSTLTALALLFPIYSSINQELSGHITDSELVVCHRRGRDVSNAFDHFLD